MVNSALICISHQPLGVFVPLFCNDLYKDIKTKNQFGVVIPHGCSKSGVHAAAD
jgi:hypothetical protein